MRLVVKNVCGSNLPLKGTGVAISPGTQLDLCSVISGSVSELKQRPDISRWLQTNRLQIIDQDAGPTEDQPSCDKLDADAEAESAAEIFEDPDDVQVDPSLQSDDLDQLSNTQLRLKCIDMGLHPPRKKEEKIRLIRSVGNEPLDTTGDSE